jgi:23S rRNA (adenine2503-C2)-methyltransferase
MKTESKTQLKGMTLGELENHFLSIGQPKYRAKQLFNWMYNHISFDFMEMQNFPKELRQILSENYDLRTLDLIATQDSASTGTKKFLFKTHDDKNIEAVLIPEKERNTLCISTQVGCPLDCKFCATGLMGYKRNLTAGEIVDQYLIIAKEAVENKITNIVYMGMGEPLINFENTLKSIEIFVHESIIGLSRTRLTLSTAGVANKIKELTEKNIRIKLAFSLHSPFGEVRSKIMPINKKYSLQENLDALKEYAMNSKTRITFEYTMLKGINDRIEDARELTRICSKLPCKINIIPFNSIKHMNLGGISAELEATSTHDLHKFAERLRDNNITVMVRETQGDDIAAACGQLAVQMK